MGGVAGGEAFNVQGKGSFKEKGQSNSLKLNLQEITFIGCYTYSPFDLRITLDKLHSGALGSLEWAETRNLSDGADAFSQILKVRCVAPKVILKI